jgi:hypothetical protein
MKHCFYKYDLSPIENHFQKSCTISTELYQWHTYGLRNAQPKERKEHPSSWHNQEHNTITALLVQFLARVTAPVPLGWPFRFIHRRD